MAQTVLTKAESVTKDSTGVTLLCIQPRALLKAIQNSVLSEHCTGQGEAEPFIPLGGNLSVILNFKVIQN